MRHFVHVYASVRVKIAVDGCTDHASAIDAAVDAFDPEKARLFNREFVADEDTLPAELPEPVMIYTEADDQAWSYLVDEAGDEDYSRSVDYEADGRTPSRRDGLPNPLPIDLIIAARDVIAAYGGDVPDWLASEIGMLELALKPFADVQPPMPPAKPLALGDDMPIRRLEQREGAELHTLCAGFWNVIHDALGLDGIGDDDAEHLVEAMLREHGYGGATEIGGLDYVAALVTVKRDGVVEELWASDRFPENEGVPFTCVWLRSERGPGSYTSADILARFDEGEINDAQAIAELQTRGWTEHRAYVVLEQHING